MYVTHIIIIIYLCVYALLSFLALSHKNSRGENSSHKNEEEKSLCMYV